MLGSLRSLVVVLPLGLVLTAGCAGSDTVGDVPTDDSGVADSTTDDSMRGDTARSDTGATDTGGGDSARADTATGDTRSGDTGAADSGAVDTSSGDTGAADSGVADTGTPDTADLDTGTLDADLDTTPPDLDTGSLDTSIDETTIDSGVLDAPDAAARGPAPVLLGGAGVFVILAESKISNVPTSAITGDLGISPFDSTSITGFTLTKVGTFFTAVPEVVGRIYAVDNDTPTPAMLTTAITDMTTAYTDAAGRPTPDFTDLATGAIGGLILTPGLYQWSSSVTIDSNVTISGGPNDTWIFQVTGDLKEGSAALVKLDGGALAKNIVWQVAGLVDLGTTSHLEGVVLCKTGISLEGGASVNGRLLAQTAVTLIQNTITEPTP